MCTWNTNSQKIVPWVVRWFLQHFGFPPENIQMGSSRVFYRAEEHRKLELDRSIVLEQQNLENWLYDMINQDPNSLPNPEEYYEELSRAVHRANVFKLDSQNAHTARQLLEDFIEARIDPERMPSCKLRSTLGRNNN
eukprot:TRINITY_DN7886_c0_g1_i1.p1 TRINITY_DN7886_c0_g1~~TRINITY_DN7886_c0_g1_i1.p1  ORF type:complete len:137 (-),score=20.15 TRINITY_DN7886_c0_g1_i1:282-692(-)